MKKFIFFPIWDCERIDNIMHDYEKHGLRVYNIKFNYWFEFKESQPKDMTYFTSYCTRSTPSIANIEYFISKSLDTEHHGIKIESKYCIFDLYRTPCNKSDLESLRRLRAKTMKKRLFFMAILTIVFIILFILIFIFPKNSNTFYEILSTIIFPTLCMYSVYNLTGFLICRKKCKETDSPKKE